LAIGIVVSAELQFFVVDGPSTSGGRASSFAGATLLVARFTDHFRIRERGLREPTSGADELPQAQLHIFSMDRIEVTLATKAGVAETRIISQPTLFTSNLYLRQSSRALQTKWRVWL
jgi:hypothetical protein